MNARSPIGVFDSGFGGLTVFRKVRELLPAYDYIYLGDNARTPYGNRSFEAVLRFTTAGVDALFALGCPLIIIACNTASAKALRSVQQLHLPRTFPDRRVLGVIRPTVEAIEHHTRSGEVALWATAGTVLSNSFALEIEKHSPGVRLVVQQPCPLLVPLVEAGELEGAGLDYFLLKYWRATEARAPHADTLLLGCTHYPLLLPRLRELLPSTVSILSQDQLVAPSLADYLRRHPEMETRLSRGGETRFLTTDTCEHFDHLAAVFMGQPLASEKIELAC